MPSLKTKKVVINYSTRKLISSFWKEELNFCSLIYFVNSQEHRLWASNNNEICEELKLRLRTENVPTHKHTQTLQYTFPYKNSTKTSKTQLALACFTEFSDSHPSTFPLYYDSLGVCIPSARLSFNYCGPSSENFIAALVKFSIT